MKTKEYIIDNVDQFKAEELVGFIGEGLVTLDELCETGQLSVAVRREIEHKLKFGDADEWEKVKQENTIEAVERYLQTFPNGQFRQEARDLKDKLQNVQQTDAVEEAWTLVDKNDVDALRMFNITYPHSAHEGEATARINELISDTIIGFDVDSLVHDLREIQTNGLLDAAQKDYNIESTVEKYLSKSISKQDFLVALAEDHNLLNAHVVKNLVSKGILSLEDLLNINIDRQFIQKMYKSEEPQSFPQPRPLDKIHKQSTEIYFWGIPSSGKSCALGAILSVAANGRIAHSMDPDVASQGYGYMMKLINLFQEGRVGTLMGGTAVDSFYEMGFDLVDSDNKVHPITCIDMAGELMRCMFKENAGDPLAENQEMMLDTMTKVLIDNRSTSRKMHIFVIEYGAEDRLYEGLPQQTYLNGAVSYIKNTGIFRKDTDAVYIMITKADKMRNLTREGITDYVNEKYYGFYNALEQICKDNEINKGRVEKIAFSLGDVCFQNYCMFDPRAAENVVRLILARSASYRTGKRGTIEKVLRG